MYITFGPSQPWQRHICSVPRKQNQDKINSLGSNPRNQSSLSKLPLALTRSHITLKGFIVGQGQMQANLHIGMIKPQHAVQFCAQYLDKRPDDALFILRPCQHSRIEITTDFTHNYIFIHLFPYLTSANQCTSPSQLDGKHRAKILKFNRQDHKLDT